MSQSATETKELTSETCTASHCKLLNVSMDFCQCLSLVGPTVWNPLPDSLHNPAVECFSVGLENAFRTLET